MKRLLYPIVLVALACSVLAPAAAKQPLRVTLVDVEGGGATLIVTPEGKSVLVDTGWPDGSPGAGGGSSADRIVAAARRLGLVRFDYVIITHYHLDHVGGLRDLLARFPVGIVMDHGPNREPRPDGPASPSQAASLFADYEVLVARRPRQMLNVGDRLRLGSLKIDVVTADGDVTSHRLAPHRKAPGGCGEPAMAAVANNENPRSIGIVASFGKARLLSLSDATVDIERRLVCPVNRIGPIDLLIVSHHGSAQSSSPELVEAVAPRIALIGNGATKGGDKRVFETLAAASSRPVVWQQHAATRSPEIDRPSDFVGNLTDRPDGYFAIDAAIWEDGTIELMNARNRAKRRYAPPSR